MALHLERLDGEFSFDFEPRRLGGKGLHKAAQENTISRRHAREAAAEEEYDEPRE
jgi:hypothetical protein